MLEPSLDLYGGAHQRVGGLLEELLAKSRARYALVVDRKGFVLVHRRAVWAPKPPSLDSLATLVASNHSANAAIAQLFGDDGFTEMVHQGHQVGTVLDELGNDALLLVVFDQNAQLGKVKVYTKSAAEQIREVLGELDRGGAPRLDLDEAWSESTDALLDSLFGPGER